MKKLFFTLFLVLSVMAASAKAPFPFDVQAPAWTKLAVPSLKSKAKVTVYKQPSATSAKLYVHPLEGDCGDDYEFRTTAKRGWYVYDFQESEPILAEKSGFYEVNAGWIKATSCDVVDVDPIDPKMLNDYDYRFFTSGPYAGYCVHLNCDVPGEYEYEIGKMVGNFIVLKYVANFFDVYEKTNVFKNVDMDDYGGLKTFKESDFPLLLEVAQPFYENTVAVIYAVDDDVQILYGIVP